MSEGTSINSNGNNINSYNHEIPSSTTSPTPTPTEEKVNDIPKSTPWGKKLECAEQFLKFCKKAFKYPQKVIKQLKMAESKGMFTTDFLSWMKTPNAVEIYIFLAGTILLTYKGLDPAEPNASLKSRIGKIGSKLLTESRKITESYALLTSIQNIYQSPKPHLYPLIFAISMISVGRLLQHNLSSQ